MHIILKKGGAGLIGLVAVGTVAVAICAAAEEPLRWKFELGEKLNYNTAQDMTITVTGAEIGPRNVILHQELDMKWEVVGVNDEGEAVIQEKFDRIKMKATLPPPVGTFEYDTKSDKPLAGLAASLAPMFKTLTEAEFELTMTARGAIKDIKVPNEVVAALKNSPLAAAMGEMATPEGFKKMITRGSLVLPEQPPKPGEITSSKATMNEPGGGKQIIESAYRYEDKKNIDGVTYAVFRPSLTLSYEGIPQIKIAKQESSGEALFNIPAGRLNSTTLAHNITIDANVDGQKVQQTIDQKIDVKMTPAGEKEAEKPKPNAEKAKP